MHAPIVVARSRRARSSSTSRTCSPAFLGGRRRAAVVDLHAGLRIDRHRRQGDADPSVDPRTSWAVSFETEDEQQHHLRRGARTIRRSRRPDRARARSDDRRAGGTLNAIAFDFQHSTADNLLNARRGYQLALHGERPAAFLPGTFNYTRAACDARHYLPIGERLVVANRVQVGNINPGRRRSGQRAVLEEVLSSAARRASADGAATR